MFFEAPDWQVGKPVSEEAVIAARKEDAIKMRGSRAPKKVTFKDGESEQVPKLKKIKKADSKKNPESKAVLETSADVTDSKVKEDLETKGDDAHLKMPEKTIVKKSGIKPAKNALNDESSKLKAKLSGARFRFLNQKFYESDSKSALQYFQENRDDFFRYHEGFQEQTKKWPTNPVDVFIEEICGLVEGGKEKRLTVADIGCGEGKLGLEVMKRAEEIGRRGVTVHSFDLVSCGPHVIVASMTRIPLPDSSVDIAIFSLSLMNTDFCQALLEANRILRPRGTLLIAEVESRFEGGRGGVEQFVGELKGLGFEVEGKVDFSYKVFVMMRFGKVRGVKSAPAGMSLKVCKYKKR